MGKFLIKEIKANEIIDSRGNPTVETSIVLDCGAKGIASVPSGASTGSLEAVEIRDKDMERYNGKGVLKACSNVNNKIAQALVGKKLETQEKVDKKMIELDGTKNKSKLGANAILSVSLAFARAIANAKEKPLYVSICQDFGFSSHFRIPSLVMNIVNGGMHASTNLAIQEFQIIFSGNNASENIESGSEIFKALGAILEEHGLDTDTGDEGGYAPHVDSIEQVFEMILEAIETAKIPWKFGIGLGIDSASGSFYDVKKKKYSLNPPSVELDSIGLLKRYLVWAKKYNLISIEDPFYEKSWKDWSELIKEVDLFSFDSREKHHISTNDKIMIVGDDLLVTNPKKIEKAYKEKAVNAVLIKPNQIGTLTETIESIKVSKKYGFKTVVSHRSGETNDSFISDLAVAVSADYIKAGAPSRGERVAKYNRLLEIEREL